METSRPISKGNLWLLIAGFTLLTSLPFLVPRLGFLSLVGFVPLFLFERLLTEYRVKHAFWYYYTAFLLFNIATTFWIWFVSPAGAIAALLLNALQMAAIFALFRWGGRILRRKVKDPTLAEALSLCWFILTWLAWEHIYFNIELSWPWLCLGNSFAYNLYSEIRYATYQETNDPMEVVVVQPNIDPFHKYGVTPQAGLDERLVQLLAQEVTPQTRFVVTPETFTYDVDIDNPLLSSPSLRTYAAFLSAHPGTDLLLGALTYRRFFNTYAKPSRSARPGGAGQWVDVYNTALVMDSQQVYGSYVKSKLVPGVEIIPYENVLKFLGPIVQKFGGSSSSYGTQDEMDAIPTSDGSKLGAMICDDQRRLVGRYARLPAALQFRPPARHREPARRGAGCQHRHLRLHQPARRRAGQDGLVGRDHAERHHQRQRRPHAVRPARRPGRTPRRLPFPGFVAYAVGFCRFG